MSLSISDLIQSTIDSSKERIKTPITGAYICSFVIYNWQPLLILLFSDCTIEARIGEAKPYFKTISFLWPLAMALFFTILIPLLMWGLDSINMFAKKKRLAKSFQNRRNLIKEKMDIADDVNALKHKESGNKEIQDYIDQIKALEDSKTQLEQSIAQIRETDKLTIEQLNQSLAESNTMIQNLRNTMNHESNRDIVYEETIDGQEIRETIAGIFRKTNITSEGQVLESNEGKLNFMLMGGYIEKSDSGYRLTKRGKSLWNLLN